MSQDLALGESVVCAFSLRITAWRTDKIRMAPLQNEISFGGGVAVLFQNGKWSEHFEECHEMSLNNL